MEVPMLLLGTVLLVAIVLTLLLVVVGVMRELVIVREEVTSLSNLVVNPPALDVVGNAIPENVVAAMPEADASMSLIVVSGSCPGCHSLVRAVVDEQPNGVLLLFDERERSSLQDDARSAAIATYWDRDGSVSRTLGVTATPMAFRMKDGVVADYSLGGSAAWVMQPARA